MVERHSARLVVNTQIKVCSKQTHSLSLASTVYGHKPLKNNALTRTVTNSGRTALLNAAYTVGVHCKASQALNLTAAAILADVADARTVSEMT